jgi:hypothetical protein
MIKYNFPLVNQSKPSKYRQCSICTDGTIADVEYSFKSGINSSTAIAYCRKHEQQMIAEMSNFKK